MEMNLLVTAFNDLILELKAVCSFDSLRIIFFCHNFLLIIATISTMPRRYLTRNEIGHNIPMYCLLLLYPFLRNPYILTMLFVINNSLCVRDFSRTAAPRYQGIVRCSLHLSSLFAIVSLLGKYWATSTGTGSSIISGIFLMVAIMIRKGIFPFHSFIPAYFEDGRLDRVIFFCCPEIGAFLALYLLLPQIEYQLTIVLVVMAILSSFYGALLAIVQTDPRRTLAFLFIGQSSTVLAGLASLSIEGMSGGITIWLSSGLAMAGFGLTLFMLEVRRGRMSISSPNGGHANMPLLSTNFLILGLATIGFPGTLGFIGQELLLNGLVNDFPMIGIVPIVATAINGITLLRLYLYLFCGKKNAPVNTQLRRRELYTFASLVFILVALGFFPEILLRQISRSLIPFPW